MSKANKKPCGSSATSRCSGAKDAPVQQITTVQGTEPACCRNCRFWKSEDEEWGTCRRRAPRFFAELAKESTGDVSDGFFPWIEEWEWCGEWQAKEVKTQHEGHEDRSSEVP